MGGLTGLDCAQTTSTHHTSSGPRQGDRDGEKVISIPSNQMGEETKHKKITGRQWACLA